MTTTTFDGIYHEKQVRELCALHALNNLFQNKDAFSKNQLDAICQSLSPENWINPHKSMLGLGNYDVNVIIKALQSRSYDAVWFDKRKDPNCLDLNKITGFILNIPTDYKLSFITIPLRRRHWVTLRELNGSYYNLDSKLDEPKLIGTKDDLLCFIREELDSQDKEMFVVVSNEVEKEQSWLKINSNYCNKVCNLDNRDAEEILVKDIYPENNS